MFALRTTRSPLADLQVASSTLNRLFDEAFTPLAGSWMAPVDVIESKNDVRIVAELPGVKPEDIRISMENNLLVLRGEKHAPALSEEQEERAHRFERSYGVFERHFTIPATVDAERIEARYEHGVLTIVLPKAEKAKPRQITVQVQA